MASRRRAVHLTELFKDRVKLVCRNANAGILDIDGEGRRAAFDGAAGDRNQDVAGLGKLDRIAGEVGDDLADTPSITDQPVRQCRIDADNQLDVLFARPRGNERRHIFNRLAQIERLLLKNQLTGIDL